VWTPNAEQVEVHLLGNDRYVALERDDLGYRRAVIDGVGPGSRYMFRLDGDRELPDPASRFQPEGVHGASEVVALAADASEGWPATPLSDYVIYELHVGTFTPEGTFDAIVRHLDHLAELGVTPIEPLPVAQFPGSRNWGYDGVFPFAAQSTYGGPEGLRRLVRECHRRDLAVVLDVVYNHLGPEGNILGEFGPYFTDTYRTPWGDAVNFSEAGSDEVRRYFVESAVYWFEQLGVDALRLDAVHGIVDPTARPFLQELAEEVEALGQRLGRKLHLIAESSLNDPKVVMPPGLGGWGHDAHWNDDFHHALHAILTGERDGYYADFGGVEHLARAYADGYVYEGEHSVFRGRRHGSSSRHLRGDQLVVFSQNHDQVGNRALGDRLSSTLSFEQLKLVAGAVLLSPYIPLLFMGEEYGETAPFQYFISHSDPDLVEAVRKGRAEEFASFGWTADVPDPQDEKTFLRAKLDHSMKREGRHAVLLELHRELLRVRRDHAVLRRPVRDDVEVLVDAEAMTLVLSRRGGDEDEEAVLAMALGHRSAGFVLPHGEGMWTMAHDSADVRWDGPGSVAPERAEGSASVAIGPFGVLLYVRPRG
jgi:maltooligosyltrehalose trehalohydrolase